MLHLDEARNRAIDFLKDPLESAPRGAKAVLIDDLFGKLRLVLWIQKKDQVDSMKRVIDEGLSRECGPYWTGEIWLAKAGAKPTPADNRLYSRAWEEAMERPHQRLRVLDRRRNRGGWFVQLEAPWPAPQAGPTPQQPPVIVFFSFKGGVGRTTALASFAVRHARLGERVAVIDADLDAPGLGSLLPNVDGGLARWGLVDYLLERPQGDVDLRDYYHVSRREEVTGPGEIVVFPAGRVDSLYLGKLARADLEPQSDGARHPIEQLLHDVRKELKPHWILIDARAGLADPAGILLSGLTHLHVLFGTFSEQSWAGLRRVVERLGGDRVREGRPQADCLLVHSMVPENLKVAADAFQSFRERARDEFIDLYYAAEPEPGTDEGDFLYVGDADSTEAPHEPLRLSYASWLADFPSFDLVADRLATSPEHVHLAERIGARFGAS